MSEKIKERPIIFSGPMVKAILVEQKTMTRRVVRGKALEWLQPGMFSPAFVANPENGMCPYGSPGDRLWVRETWAAHEYYDGRPPRDIPEGVTIECAVEPHGVITQGDDHRPIKEGERGKWRPSIFMPRWASRITLEITGVRVERLQDISHEDALAEGAKDEDAGSYGFPVTSYAIGNFRLLWDSINAKRGYSWESNPWVWVIEFNE